MARLKVVTPESAEGKTAETYDQVKEKMGKVVNILQGMGNSPAALNAYLAMKGALADGQLSPADREVIALVSAEVNGCNYCAAAHTMAAKKAKLSDEDALAIRRGKANDEKHQALAEFTRQIIDSKGFVSDADLKAVRDAGYDDGQIAEVCAHIALNYYTNIFNHVHDTELDFPEVPAVK